MIYVCAVHMDEGLDDYITIHGSPPDVLIIKDHAEIAEPGTRCRYCSESAVYLIRAVPTRISEGN